MNMENVKENAVIKDIIFDSYYIVTGLQKDEEGHVIAVNATKIQTSEIEKACYEYGVTAEEYLKQGRYSCLSPNGQIKIDLRQSKCFRIITYYKKSEECRVKNGTLFHNGEKVDTKSFGSGHKVEGILKVFRLKVLLSVKTEKKGYIRPVLYDPTEDKWEYPLYSNKCPRPIISKLPNGNSILMFCSTHLAKDEQGEREVCDCSGFIIFDPEGKVRTTQRFLSPIGKLVEATKNYLVFQGAFDGLPFMKIIRLFDYVVFRVEFGFIESVSETESGFLLKTKESLIFLTSIDSLFLQYPSIDLQHKIDEVEGYNYVVSFDKNKDDFAVTLATSDHETIIITGRKYELIQVIPCPW